MKLCLIAGKYPSHHRAANDYRRAIEDQGIVLVDYPADADIVIIHDEPRELVPYHRVFPELRHRYVIAYTVFEADRLSDDRIRWLSQVDEIWTASTFCRNVHADLAKPIEVVPHIVAPPAIDPEAVRVLRQRLELDDDRFVFYTISRLEERKNVEAGLRAFAAAFPEGECAFVVRCHDAKVRDLVERSDVIVIPEWLDETLLQALHGLGHCYVSPHCSEGWGLGLSDAMACGNLVVATGYGGNLEFMNENNGLLVDFSFGAIRKAETRVLFGFNPHATQASWAYVDDADLVAQLRRARNQWDALAGMRRRAAEITSHFDAETIGQKIRSRLETIMRARAGAVAPLDR